MMTEFYTDNHASALVVYRHINRMFFKDDPTIGWLILDKNIHQLLEQAQLPKGGDFDLKGGRLNITNAYTGKRTRITRWGASWCTFIDWINVIGRHWRRRIIRSRFTRNPRDPFGARRWKAFVASIRGRILPAEILARIFELFWVSRIKPAPPVRRIEARSWTVKNP